MCASWLEQIVHSLSSSVFQRWSTLLGTESFWHPVTVARTAGSVLGISLSWLQVPSQGRCFCMAGSLTPKDILWSCMKFKYVHYIYSLYYEILQICFLTWFFSFFFQWILVFIMNQLRLSWIKLCWSWLLVWGWPPSYMVQSQYFWRGQEGDQWLSWEPSLSGFVRQERDGAGEGPVVALLPRNLGVNTHFLHDWKKYIRVPQNKC